MKSRVTRNRALVLLPVIIFSFACNAVAGDGSRTYWVSPNGQATWADARSDIPLSGAACCSLSTANTSARAGDIAYLRGGTCTGGPKLNSSISPSNSGTEGKMITFSAYNNEPVLFQDTPGFPSGVFLENKSYIKVHGMTFKRSECMLTILGGSHNEISHCTFDDSLLIPRVGRPRKSRIAQNSRNNWIHHCTFSRSGAIGPPPVFDDLGGLMTIGNPNSGVGNRPADDSSHNLMENNTFYYGGHHLIAINASFNVVRNNYFHNEGWMKCPPALDRPGGLAGNRSMSTYFPAARNLFEKNSIAYAGVPSDNDMGNGLEPSNSHNIIRQNRFYHNGGAGLALYQKSKRTGADNNYVYSNTFYHNGYNHVRAGEYGGIWLVRSFKNVIKNNIFHDNKGEAITYQKSPEEDQILANNWEEAGDPLFVDKSGDDPFDRSLPDLRLQAESPCVDKGGWLTVITSPSGSGTSLSVDDADYFTDGWGIIEGDLIQLEGQTQRARITNVDYDHNLIAVDTPLTWNEGQGVSLAYEGTAPDIGAYEHGEKSFERGM